LVQLAVWPPSPWDDQKYVDFANKYYDKAIDKLQTGYRAEGADDDIEKTNHMAGTRK